MPKLNECPVCNTSGVSLNHNPECVRKRRAARMRNTRQGTTRPAEDSVWPSMARKLGVSMDTLTTLMTAPCGVCGSEAPETRKHNSAYARKDTGAVVGTICQKCATALGFLAHDPARLRAALALLGSDTDHRTT